ncbi:protocadherin Fat 4-like [Anomaloglossus baeobatrachus]|uniref:protocadherin Fat 4-like n=1 Tax=Anomaloglossus baeobatrachus TaxID=238106 RepID=UPI003F503361
MPVQLLNYLLLHFASLNLYAQVVHDKSYSIIHLQGNQTSEDSDDVEFKYDTTTSTTPWNAYNLDQLVQGPVFVQDHYRASILETCEINTTILTVEAKEKGASLIRYSLSGPENEYFHMNPLNGVITLAKALEYNMINRYNLDAGAEDSLGFSNTVPVLIDIQDVDTMNPHFNFPIYEGSISENQTGRLSTHPEAIKAVDGDLGINETIYYSISKVYPTEFRRFISINHSDGIISINKKIDRETVGLINVEIKAVQQNNYLKSADSVVVIKILDENDNAPQFSQSTYGASLPENSPPGSMILVLRASDKDQDGLSNGYFHTNNTMFSVNNNGMMYFIHGELDRELTPRINVQVWVFDAWSGGLNSSAKVIINITDVNDNNPEFHNLPLRYTIPEGDYSDTSPMLVAKLNVTDLDTGVNGNVTISADDENGDETFRVQNDGNIFVCRPLDREKRDKFGIILIASDGGSPPRRSYAEAAIVIQDINDNVPTFTKEEYYANLILNKAKAGDTIMSVSATDLDIGNNSLISYRFAQPHSGFAIKEKNGDIFLTNRVSTITATSIVVPVIATDHGVTPRSSTATVIINVSEGQTEFVNSNYTFSLLEGMPEGTAVGSVKITTGPDVAVMYFVQTYATVFSVTEKGTIITHVILDREEQDSYNVIVTAVDSQDPPNTAAVVVTITVMDVNDNSPVFSPIMYLNVTCPENKNFVNLDNITATDLDIGKNGAIMYSLENYFDSTFYINSSTGKLINMKPLDAEKNDNYDLKVIAQDAGTPPLSSTVLIHVTVQDVDDNSPTFRNVNLYNITVKENEPPHVLLNVSAVDNDTGTNAVILYSFIEASNMFYIGEESGSISNLKPLDFEARAEHVLTVIAYSPNHHHAQSTATVTVHVEDVNEEGPMVEYPVYHTVIWDGEFATGSMILDVNAKKGNKNMDEGIHYSISGDNREKLFSIANATGHIFLTKDLPLHSFPEYYVFTVTCIDSGSPPQSTSVKVFVVISSSNVTVPIFSAEYYNPEPLNNWTVPHTYLIQVKAFYLHSSLNYSIEEAMDKDYFDVDPLSGRIRTKKLLQIEDFPSNVTVKAADSQRPWIYSEAIVHVTVINSNQFAPVFTNSLKKATVKEGVSVPMLIAQVQATDNDPGQNGILTYSILNNHSGLFTMDATNGKVFATTTFDYENGTHEFQVFISAEDDGIPHKKQGYLTLVIQVLDINDWAPVFSPYGDMYVGESAPAGTIIGQITATDEDSRDNAFIVYSLFDDDDQFDVDGLLGNIFIKNHLDHEVKEKSILTLTARNNKTAPFYQVKTLLTVFILDENDNAPQFTQKKYFAEIDVKSPVGSPVIAIAATDRDEGNNGVVEYSLVSDPSSTDFLFENMRNGKIITATNHLKVGEVSLTVVAKDRGSPSLSNMTSVIVNLVNKKKTLPVFSPNEVSTVLSENKPKEEPVFTFAAKNATGQNVTYRIVTGNDRGQFYLDEKDGKLWRTEKFYEDAQPFYNITVEADTPPDTQGPLSPNMAQLQITVRDIKEGPVFEQDTYFATILNTEPPGSPVIKVTAKSRGSVSNPTLIYSLVDQFGEDFHIDKDTGQIVAANLAGKTGTFHIKVQVTDKNGLSAQTEIQLQVKSPSSSRDLSEIKINQTVDEVKQNIQKIHRVLEDVLKDNVTISSLDSDPNSKQDTKITFKASGESNQDIVRKLKDNISTVKQKLGSIFGKPTDITTKQPPQPHNFALSQEAIAGIATFAALVVVVAVTAAFFVGRKTGQQGYEEASKELINKIHPSRGDDDGSARIDPTKDKGETFQESLKKASRGFLKKLLSGSGGDGSSSIVPKTDDGKTSQEGFKEASKGLINMIRSASSAMTVPTKNKGKSSLQDCKGAGADIINSLLSGSVDGSISNVPQKDNRDKMQNMDTAQNGKPVLSGSLSENEIHITGDEHKSPKEEKKQTLDQKMGQTVTDTEKQPEQNTFLYKDGDTEKEIAEVKISEDTDEPTSGQVDSTLSTESKTTEKEKGTTVKEIVDVTISETVTYVEDPSYGDTSAHSKEKKSIQKVVTVSEEEIIEDGKELKIVEEKQVEYVESWESYESTEESDMESTKNDEIKEEILEFPEPIIIQEIEGPPADGDDIKSCGGVASLYEE